MAKKKVRKKARKKIAPKKKFNIKNKISLVVYNLLLFLALCLVSLLLYKFVRNSFLNDLFFVMTMAFGFIVVSFLILLLILFIIKTVKK